MYCVAEETLRREIEAQKELYRLQIQNMAEVEVQVSSVHAKARATRKKKMV
jgi:hypothetical protein